MSYQRERDEFIAQAVRHGLPLDDARALLRAATTLNRYAEMACSSEAADRDRVPCPASTTMIKQYGSRLDRPMRTMTVNRKPTGPCICDDYPAGMHARGEHSTVPRIAVLEAQVIRRLERRIAALEPAGDCAPLCASRVPFGECTCGRADGWRIITAGDPRGYVLRVVPPTYQAENATRPEYDPRSIGVPSGPSGLKW